LSTAAWNPAEAETYMILSWNYTGQVLKPNQVIPVTLLLVVGNTAPNGRSFTFTTVISSTG